VGGAALRAGALSDPRVIALVNERFVPVWVNIRTDPLPATPVLSRVLLRAEVAPDGHIGDLFSRGFFLRSLVLTPDGSRLLNPQAETPEASVATYSQKGHFAYAQVKPDDYLLMLEGALRRFDRAGGPPLVTDAR
jgi:hypothetical protein